MVCPLAVLCHGPGKAVPPGLTSHPFCLSPKAPTGSLVSEHTQLLVFYALTFVFYIGFSALRSFRGCFLPINFLSVLMQPSLKGLLLWSSPLPTRLPTKAPYCVFLKVVGLKLLCSVICSCIYFWLLHGTQWEQVPHLCVWGHITGIRSRRESLGLRKCHSSQASWYIFRVAWIQSDEGQIPTLKEVTVQRNHSGECDVSGDWQRFLCVSLVVSVAKT